MYGTKNPGARKQRMKNHSALKASVNPVAGQMTGKNKKHDQGGAYWQTQKIGQEIAGSQGSHEGSMRGERRQQLHADIPIPSSPSMREQYFNQDKNESESAINSRIKKISRRATSKYTKKDYDAALADYDEILDITNATAKRQSYYRKVAADVLLRKARIYEIRGELPAAMDLSCNAVRLYRICREKRIAKDRRNGEKFCSQSTEQINQKMSMALVNMANIQMKMGHLDFALELNESAFQILKDLRIKNETWSSAHSVNSDFLRGLADEVAIRRGRSSGGSVSAKSTRSFRESLGASIEGKVNEEDEDECDDDTLSNGSSGSSRSGSTYGSTAMASYETHPQLREAIGEFCDALTCENMKELGNLVATRIFPCTRARQKETSDDRSPATSTMATDVEIGSDTEGFKSFSTRDER